VASGDMGWRPDRVMLIEAGGRSRGWRTAAMWPAPGRARQALRGELDGADRLGRFRAGPRREGVGPLRFVPFLLFYFFSQMIFKHIFE
jgi:hypothetical protein